MNIINPVGRGVNTKRHLQYKNLNYLFIHEIF